LRHLSFSATAKLCLKPLRQMQPILLSEDLGESNVAYSSFEPSSIAKLIRVDSRQFEAKKIYFFTITSISL
jgi:hypothetical protein